MAEGDTPGVLYLIMREARLERDTSMFMAMSPKYIINWKEDKITGKPADGGGTNPKWYMDH